MMDRLTRTVLVIGFGCGVIGLVSGVVWGWDVPSVIAAVVGIGGSTAVAAAITATREDA